MTSRTEKKRRQAIVRDIEDRERMNATARMPLSETDLDELVEWLDRRLFERRGDTLWCHCDKTLTRTREFLRTRQLPESAIVEWLNEHGHFCDCTVAANLDG